MNKKYSLLWIYWVILHLKLTNRYMDIYIKLPLVDT